MQRVMREFGKRNWTKDGGGHPVVADVTLREGEYTLTLVPTDAKRSLALPGDTGIVTLDTDVTPELEAEGLARDLVRLVQQTRRERKLDVSDRIRLHVTAPAPWLDALATHRELVMAETLALAVETVEDPALDVPAVEVEAVPR
jgi:isoleucyl-tRNA synthetase